MRKHAKMPLKKMRKHAKFPNKKMRKLYLTIFNRRIYSFKILVTVQSQPRKLSFSRCGVSAKYIFTVKCSRMQAFITFNRKNMLGSEQLQYINELKWGAVQYGRVK